MNAPSTPAIARAKLAPITTLDAIDLVTVLQPEAAETSTVPTLLTADEVADLNYEDHIEERLARYGY